jgi:hypothetical protein
MTMKNIGGLLVLFGGGSMLLGLIGYEFSLMMWVDNWGTGVGWVIRAALVVVGAVLWLKGGDVDDGQFEESDAA